MCGRFAQVIVHDQLKKLIDELRIRDLSEQIEINYNLAPTQTLAAIVSKRQSPDQASIRYFGFFRWGLIPSWAREIGSFTLINVRSESINDKPSFRTGLSHRRCLIPANGFYEWRKSDKSPFFVHPSDGDLLYMAGIYDAWTAPDGSVIPSCSIITTAANSAISPIHHRMPVILEPGSHNAWLDPHLQDNKELSKLLTAVPNDYLALRPISKLVNRISNNSPACWEEESAQELDIW